MIIGKTIESLKRKLVYIHHSNNSDWRISYFLICGFYIGFSYKCCTNYLLILTAIAFGSIVGYIANKSQGFNIGQNKIDIMIISGQCGQTWTPGINPDIDSIDINGPLLDYNRLDDSSLWKIKSALF